MPDPLMGADAPDVQSPAPAPMPAIPSAPGGIDPSAAPPPPGPAKPGLWASVLQGALAGLAGSSGTRHFGGGLSAGAKGYEEQQQLQHENQVQQQQVSADVQFKSAQAANMVIQGRLAQKELDALPQKIQDEHTDQVLSQLEHIKAIFPGAQITVTPNDTKSIMSAMASETKTNGGVSPALHLNAGDKIYSVDLNSLSASPAGLVLVNDGLRKMGKPPIEPAVWQGMDTQVRNNYLTNAANFGTETPSDAKVTEYKGYLETVKAKPDYPQKASDIAELQKSIGRFQNGADAAAQTESDRKSKEAGAVATASENAKKPFVEQEHQFQSNLQTSAKTLDRANADTVARNLEADKMVTKEANDRDSDLKNIVDLKTNLAQIDNKNQAATSAFQTKFAEHEIVEGGVKRLNETELNALTKGLGDYGRQFSAWVDKGFKGDMPKATKDDMLTILNSEEQARNNLYNSRVGNIHQNILKQSGPTVTAGTTQVGAIKTFPNGKTGKWDGKGWVAQ